MYNIGEYEIYHSVDDESDWNRGSRIYKVCTLNGEPPLVDLVPAYLQLTVFSVTRWWS